VIAWYEIISSYLAAARWRAVVAALFFYLIMSGATFLRLVPEKLDTSSIGLGSDQSFFVWCLKWWPYAIAHHLNPFVSRFLFVPVGFNLTWSSSAPLMAVLALPFTLTLGPVAAYNLLCILCPAANAWSAFILCRHLGAHFWPSLVGGWLFGFSPFVFSHALGGHLALFAVFLLPLTVSVVLMRLDEQIGARTFMCLTCALLVGEFLIFTETFAITTLIGAAALTLGWLFARCDLRGQIQALLRPIAFAYVGTALLVSPYLYYLFIGFRMAPYYSALKYSANLMNFVVPTKTTALWYAAPIFQGLSSSSVTDPVIFENGSYVGLPLLIVAGWYMIENRRTVASRMCAALLIMTIVLSMGPVAHVGRSAGWRLPWQLFTYVPLLDQALPIRLTICVSLILAVLAAMWLTKVRLNSWIRAAAAVLLIGSTFPNISINFWHRRAKQTATFFTDKNRYHHYLNKGETVAILPFDWGPQARSMGWQAQTGMYFRMAGGYVAFTPPAYVRWPAVRASIQKAEIPGSVEQWKGFFASHNVSVVIIQHQASITTPEQWVLKQVFSGLGLAAVSVGDIDLYRIPPGVLASYRNATPLQMEKLEDEQRFTMSLIAAHRYLADGGDPASLSPASAARLGLFPMEWTTERQTESDFCPWLHTETDGTVSVGVVGTYPAVCPLIERYGQLAKRIFFPHPYQLGQYLDALGDMTDPHWLVMVFDRGSLDSAATIALAGSSRPKPGEQPLLRPKAE
jgi:hypothetical protein